ncbi:MAG: MoxR family ATPase [Ignavibacteria bacterium]|jgi:MoxR-like ATPase|nr:MoxR family ATPase [Ignavibacteria bacterium]MDH7526701.1 MoxR family ATPase [Ignavibacteria bacterium]
MFKSDIEAVEALSSSIKKLKQEIKKVIVGQDEIIENLLIALLSKGHCLLIGVPGLAKTLLIKTLAQALDLKFSRIQFTPDLMPSDITGTEILEIDPATNQRVFKFIKGPIFTNILLADEINRTPPKTQSALLEAMQELQVTAAGNKYQLDEPFFVLATQNPIEQEGTYPLPEAQLDRFMFNLWLDYPSKDEEIQIVKTTTAQYSPEVSKVMNKDEIKYFQELVRRVPVADNVIEFAVRLTNMSRPVDGAIKFVKDNVSWGAGPRASQFMIIAAKARSAMNGSFTPTIDDVKSVALPILRHRIIPTFSAEADGITSADIVKTLLEQIN